LLFKVALFIITQFAFILMPANYALISVFDKEGIVEFARSIKDLGYSIISTGGTAKLLKESEIDVTPIEEVTGNPEMLDGRIKTISMQIEGSILVDWTNPEHVKQAEEFKLLNISLVVCNLYPFEKENEIENIDVGGPTMLRSAAKNYKNVLPVIDPKDYERAIEFLKQVRNTPHPNPLPQEREDSDKNFRVELAAKTFGHLSFYDSQVAKFFRKQLSHPELDSGSRKESLDSSVRWNDRVYPDELTIPGRKVKELRYGENPHQSASLYLTPNSNSPFNKLEHITGRELSMMNVTDINAGLEAVRIFDEPAAVVIKHNTPCGIALGSTPSEALQRAIDADPESAFGGVVVMNKPFDKLSAEVVTSFKDERKGLFDIVAAPGIDQDAQDVLKSVRKTMGVYVLNGIRKPAKEDMVIKEIIGGFTYQSADFDTDSGRDKWEVVTKVKPSEEQMKQMEIAWKFIRRMRSNTVVIMDKTLPQTTGIGTGQTSRYRAALMAIELAGEKAEGCVLASDAFFPFDDIVSLAAKNRIGAIVQSGGSINDKASIEAADKAGIPMVFTNERTFWHY
jgi:phosphoribosylaminoimidazolecarboxamide formyltransferase / IMP cyclohydrolase